MADTKISALTAVVTPALSDVVAVVQGGVTKKETLTQVRTVMVPIVLTGGADVSGTLPAASVVQATGTGIPHVVGGALSAASSLIVNADVDAAAAIAASKVVQATGTGIPHVVAGALAAASSLIVNADVDAAAAIAMTKLAGSSADLRGALTDETGTGAAVFANTPTLVTPALGAATGTSLTVTGKVTAGGQAFSGGITNVNTGTQHNITRAAIIRLTDGINITGIDATGAADGELVLLLIPALGTGITLLHNTGSSAANQITTWNAGTINVYENSWVALRYDLTATKWKFMKEGFA